MVNERLAEIVQLRPGRYLFVRHWILGETDKDSLKQSTTTTTSGGGAENIKRINLICVHGTAATQEQFLPLLESLEIKLQASSLSSSLSWIVHCWMWDAVGCGKSPKMAMSTDKNSVDPYSDSETIQDIQALIQQYVDTNLPIYFMGHSYGPQWIYKYCLLQKQQQDSNRLPAGMILISTGLLGDGLVNQGPIIFRILPLVILNCLQPMMTKAFLKIGFSQKTHREKPEMIESAIVANNQNDMQAVCHYYRNHEWLPTIPSDLLDVPSLVVHGVEDGVVPIHHGQRVANQLNTKLVSVDSASHMVLQEEPDQIASHIVSFLEKNT